MGFFNSTENRVKCGKCNTEFDFSRNNGCPLCGLGNKASVRSSDKKLLVMSTTQINYLEVPKEIKVKSGKVTTSKETKAIGSWGMFNSFFPGKATLRILANSLHESKKESIPLNDLVKRCSEVFKIYELSSFRGFPNDPDSESSIGRLVNHFIKTFTDMGFLKARAIISTRDSLWDEPWANIEIAITKEGLEFAKINNALLDEQKETQVLTNEEKVWLLAYLKLIDQDYKEFTMLLAVYKFIKSGKI